jgi:nucleoside-diphosphate-sugar epimerase
MKNRNVVVTGGAGFIGTNLAFALLEQNANVSVLVLPRDDCTNFPSEVRILRADINNREELRGLFEGQQYVFHLAARCDLGGKRLADYKTNYEGTVNVIEEIKQDKSLKRFVLYSTQLVVAIFNVTRFIDESEPYRTKTPYGESKIIAEKVTVELCKKYAIPYTIIRPTSVYGPYGKEPYESFFRMIRDGKILPYRKGK